MPRKVDATNKNRQRFYLRCMQCIIEQLRDPACALPSSVKTRHAKQLLKIKHELETHGFGAAS